MKVRGSRGSWLQSLSPSSHCFDSLCTCALHICLKPAEGSGCFFLLPLCVVLNDAVIRKNQDVRESQRAPNGWKGRCARCLRPAPLHLPLLSPPSLGSSSNELAFFPHPSYSQLKISFSETALETTYQYPSESSVLEDLGPEPEAPMAPLATQPDDDDEEEEEELLLQPGLQGGLHTKALIVGKWLQHGWRRAPPGVHGMVVL